MAIKVKVVERPVEDVSYIRATLRGMGLTVKHLFDVSQSVRPIDELVSRQWPAGESACHVRSKQNDDASKVDATRENGDW